MPVYHSDFDFGKAYQDHILREVESGRLFKQAAEPVIGIRDRMLLHLGESLINLGIKISPDVEAGCIELYPEQA